MKNVKKMNKSVPHKPYFQHIISAKQGIFQGKGGFFRA